MISVPDAYPILFRGWKNTGFDKARYNTGSKTYTDEKVLHEDILFPSI